eukprot:9474364-Pyramimonas_sp.AAC.2
MNHAVGAQVAHAVDQREEARARLVRDAIIALLVLAPRTRAELADDTIALAPAGIGLGAGRINRKRLLDPLLRWLDEVVRRRLE